MKKIVVLILVYLICIDIIAQHKVQLDYYLPKEAKYNTQIPTPESLLGYQVGEWHVSHDQLVYYMKALDAASDRITIEEYGRTHENRPLLLLTITSKENHANIKQIKEEHLKLTDPAASGKLDINNMPAVLWMGYSVHGNEPSGSNAALLMAYYLAAAEGAEIDKILKEAVILIDPAINPDGLNRFASWVNSHKGANLVTDPNNREQNEAWPRGRTNHYWFDLNRDWLPLQHPESRGRLAKYHEWKPNVLTDHHEMGTNSTFFFQPGVPSRNHPLTPETNFKLTAKIGEFHAKALDKIGSLYFTKEDYDDFYYGKGSTYPDINGAIGILFEQASSRGHAQESENGILTFPFTIRNQVTTSLSTIEAVNAMRSELLAHQREFYQNAAKQAGNEAVKAYIFGSPKDKARSYQLAEIIKQHQIDVFKPKQSVTVNNKTFNQDDSFIIPLNQKQFKLIQAMFEKRTQFKDSLFYDISAWTFPLAFGLDYEEISGQSFNNMLGDKVEQTTLPKGTLKEKATYAYIFEWHGYYAPRALNRLLQKRVKVKVATEAFTDNSGKKYGYGSILVPVLNQSMSSDELYTTMQNIANEDGIDIYTVGTGLSTEGVNLGSPTFKSIHRPEIMLLVDGGVNSYDAGEVWHLLDKRMNMKLSMIPLNTFNKISLDRYNVLVMVDGNYNDINTAAREKLKTWVQRGGTVVAMQDAAKWLSDNGISNAKFRKDTTEMQKQRPYAELDNNRGAQLISGAIFEVAVDISHPLAFGYTNKTLPIFRSNALFMERSKSPYANPLMYTANPLISGYISKDNAVKIKNTAAVGVHAYGAGRVISMTDNPNFRAFWYGTNKLFMNSIFFGPIINGESAR